MNTLSLANRITALSTVKTCRSFAAFDIETVTRPDNNHAMPVAISFHRATAHNVMPAYFEIDRSKIDLNDLTTLDTAVDAMFNEFFNYLCTLPKSLNVIYAHNLGGFDGYVMFKSLVK